MLMWLAYVGCIILGAILGFIVGVMFMEGSVQDYKDRYEELYQSILKTEEKCKKYFEEGAKKDGQEWW